MAAIFNSALRAMFAWLMAAGVYITRQLVSMSIGLLDYITGNNFVKWDYTTNNPVVNAGLSITRNFVNLALVVILIFIALSIALKLKEYASQRTLFKLIGVALLVNFAPLLCGLIIDACNILMNYFLHGAKNASDVMNGLGGQEDSVITQLKGNPGTNPFAVIARGTVMIMMNIGLAIAFFLFAFTFLIRYVMIWLLVILSPLAFVAMILPSTSSMWKQWWKAFFQWATIGISMAFFLYLSVSSFNAINSVFNPKTQNIALPGVDSESVGLIQYSFSYIIVLIMMYLGFLMGAKGSVMGAGAVSKWMKESPKKVAKWAGKGVINQTTGRIAQTGWMQRRIEQLNSIRTIGDINKEEKGLKKVERIVGSGLWSAVGGRWATKGLAGYRIEQQKKMEAEGKKFEEKFGSDEQAMIAAKRAHLPVVGSMAKVAAAKAMAKTPEGRKAMSGMGDREFEKLTGLVGKYDVKNLKNILSSKPEMISNFAKDQKIIDKLLPKGKNEKEVQTLIAAGVSETEAIEKAVYKKIVDSLKPEDAASVVKSLDALKGKPEYNEMIEALTRHKGPNFVLKLADEGGGEHVVAIDEKRKEIGAINLAMTNTGMVGIDKTPLGSQLFSALNEQFIDSAGKVRDRQVDELVNEKVTDKDGNIKDKVIRDSNGNPEIVKHMVKNTVKLTTKEGDKKMVRESIALKSKNLSDQKKAQGNNPPTPPTP